jgi:hypothetical protein
MNELFNLWMLIYDEEDQPWVLGFKWNGSQPGRVAPAWRLLQLTTKIVSFQS